MTDQGAGCGKAACPVLRGGRVSTCVMGEILWHRRETRRQKEKTSITLPRWECLSYSKPRFLKHDYPGELP